VKIQLIRLEEHDDIVSARDKLGWGQTGRVVIVWPEQGKRPVETMRAMASRSTAATPLTRRLDLVLLQRRAHELGVQLALVTHHPQVRENALSLGIPVFNSPRQAQQIHWGRTRRRRFAWQRSNMEERRTAFRQQLAQEPTRHPLAASTRLPFVVRAFVFIIGMLAIIALLAALLPGAHITLVPAIQTQRVTLPISASSKYTAVNLTGEVPTYPISTTVEGQSTIDTTATIPIPDQFATGYVRFTNLTTQTITVPLGTVVTAPYTDTIRFTTTQTGTVPAGPDSSLFMTIRAIEPGSIGNLPSGDIRVIEGSLNYRLAVANIASTRGGSDRKAPSPSLEDRTRLSNQLIAILHQNALIDLEAKLPSGDLLLKSSMASEKIIMEKYEPENTMPAVHLRLTLRMQFSTEAISGADLRRLGAIVLDSSLPSGYTPLHDTLEIVLLTQPQVDRDGIAHLQITAQRSIQANLSTEKAVNLALGLPPQQAIKQLVDSFSLASPPKITIEPGWWPRLPFIPLRIIVTDMGVKE
jgi:Baseplate J-like protein